MSNKREVFYVAAITVVHTGNSNIFLVHTNAGTQVRYSYEELLPYPKQFFDKNVQYAVSITPQVTLVCERGMCSGL